MKGKDPLSQNSTRVFISYASDDRAIAEEIARYFMDAGFEVWTDRQIRPGAHFTSDIQGAMEEADVFVFLISRAATRSQWLPMEMAAAVVTELREAGKTIVPVVLEKNADVPFFLRRYQWIDATDPEHLAQGLDDLVIALRLGSQTRDKEVELGLERRNLAARQEYLLAEQAHYEVVRSYRLWTIGLVVLAALLTGLIITSLLLSSASRWIALAGAVVSLLLSFWTLRRRGFK